MRTIILPRPSAAAIARQKALLEEENEPPREPPSVFSRRSFRQLGLFFGGSCFVMFSVLLTKRAVARHQIKAQLRFFQPTHRTIGSGPKEKLPDKDPLVAVEALNLATLNVISFGIAMVGGAAWALDVSSLDDLRRLAKRSMHGAGTGARTDEEAEREMAEWVATTLGLGLKVEDGPTEGVPEGGGHDTGKKS